MGDQAIKCGILNSFDNTTYTCSVMVLEATSTLLTGVPIATHIDGTSAIIGNLCAVLFFDEQNTTDAAVIAMFPNGNAGIPTPPPGRTVFVTGAHPISGVTITANTVQTFTLTGSGGIPAGALGIVFKAYYTSATVGAYIQIYPHSASAAFYANVGGTQVANQLVFGNGIVQVDASGKVDIRAAIGDCTVDLYTYGYIF
jgi:hypothetical protein